MPRIAQCFVFHDGVGRDSYTYTGNDRKFLDFLDWYTNFCKHSNEVLFVVGEYQSGRSTFMSHCLNFLDRKGNYEVLEIRGLQYAAEKYQQLPSAKTEWIPCEKLSEEELPMQMCRSIIKDHPVSKMLSRVKVTFKASQGPGSPENALELALLPPEKQFSLQNLVQYLKDNCNGKYVIWLKSLQKEHIPVLMEMHKELMNMGAHNIGIVGSLEPCSEVLKAGGRIISFDPISVEEAIVFIAAACREGDNYVRFDMEVANMLLSHGCDSFGKLGERLLSIEKISPNYISVEAAKQVMQEDAQ